MIYLIAFVVGSLILEIVVEWLNLSRLSDQIPEEFSSVYDRSKYTKAQNYLKATTKFELLESTFGVLLIIGALGFDVFDQWDLYLRGFIDSSSLRGLAFAGGLMIVGQILTLPFEIWSTFVIEEKFGFNRITTGTFISDHLKALGLAALIGGPILYALFEIWSHLPNQWFYAWLFLTAVQLFIMFVAPVTIMPLFNKFQPLPEGELRTAIESYAKDVDFKMQGIFTMDGSKRSTKANAYFTGFGRFRRIVLFDTLIQKNTTEELVAILAHEVGHYKLKHIFRHLYLSIFVMGFTFYLMHLFAQHPFIFEAFGMSEPSVYAGLIFFGILYAPLSNLVDLYSLYLSRKYEFEADEYSKKTYGKPIALSEALKKLSADSLSNLNPHPLKVFLEYTHPPVLDRIRTLAHIERRY